MLDKKQKFYVETKIEKNTNVFERLEARFVFHTKDSKENIVLSLMTISKQKPRQARLAQIIIIKTSE